MRLLDRVAIVTGAGRGIGRAVAEKMAAQGARVVVADRDVALARETAAELNATPVVVDIGDPQSVEKLFAIVVQQFRRIDILVNNAGVGITKSVVDTPSRTGSASSASNSTGSFLCCQQAARQMMGGRRAAGSSTLFRFQASAAGSAAAPMARRKRASRC